MIAQTRVETIGRCLPPESGKFCTLFYNHPGLVHPLGHGGLRQLPAWHDKQTGKTFVRPDSGKCLHYYFYFMDAEFGLIYMRAPAWSPFRLQFYLNGHGWLARQLADGLSPDQLYRILDGYAERCCPVSIVFGQTYHWSLMLLEYATDLAFRSTATLGPLYEQLIRETALSVKAEQIASFLGCQIAPQLVQEIGSRFSTRIEGTCVKHRFGKSPIGIYDKVGIVLRIETTTHDVSYFKHHRKVEHQTAYRRWQDREGDKLLRTSRQRPAAGVAKSRGSPAHTATI